MSFDSLLNLYRTGFQYGLLLGGLSWLFGYGIAQAINFFKRL